MILAETIIRNTSEKETAGDFWANGEVNLLLGMMLIESAKRDEANEEMVKMCIENAQCVQEFPDGTFPKLYATMVDKDNGLVNSWDPASKQEVPGEFIKTMKRTDPWFSAMSLYSQGTGTVQKSNISGLGVRLNKLNNLDVARMLSRPEIDLEAPAKKKCAYFVIMDDVNTTLNFIASLFFSSLFTRILAYADNQPNQKCKVAVNLLLDEFASIGKLPDFDKKIAVTRSRDVNLVLIFQQISQLESMYPDKVWNTILGNCATMLLLGSGDDITSKFFSDRLGTMTIRTKGQRVGKKTVDPFETHPEYQEQYSENKRLLFNPEEIEALGAKDKVLVKLVNQDVAVMDKFFYKKHPYFMKIQYAESINVREYFEKVRSRTGQSIREDRQFHQLIQSINSNDFNLELASPKSEVNEPDEDEADGVNDEGYYDNDTEIDETDDDNMFEDSSEDIDDSGFEEAEDDDIEGNSEDNSHVEQTDGSEDDQTLTQPEQAETEDSPNTEKESIRIAAEEIIAPPAKKQPGKSSEKSKPANRPSLLAEAKKYESSSELNNDSPFDDGSGIKRSYEL
jgi:type IV secretory pathway TraG/TraD family ATPase VirD4